MQVQLESTPPGADARTSLGPGCKTPCSVTVPTPEGSDFTVTYTLDKFQPATVPVQVIHVPAIATRPATSIPIRSSPNFSASARRRSRPGRKCTGRDPKPPKAAAAPAAAESPFPDPAPAPAPAPAAATARRPPADCLHCTTTAPNKGADCAGVATCLHCARARRSLTSRLPRRKAHLNERRSAQPCPSDDRSVRPDRSAICGCRSRIAAICAAFIACRKT